VSPTPVLSLNKVTKSFGAMVANDNISLELAEGEVLALLGENGAGKTTLMNILFGHYVADSGTVTVFDRKLPPGSPRAAIDAGVGMVHQHFTLADNLTVLDNVVLGTQPLWSLRLDVGIAIEKLRKLADDFGLEIDPLAYVRSLSVGERQRVEILKALYRDARILIMDEPTAVLTPPEVESLFVTLRKLIAKGLSVVFISHKLGEVMDISDRVVVLRGGRLVYTTATGATSRGALAEAMVGRTIPQPSRIQIEPGQPLLALEQITVRAGGRKALLDGTDLTLHEHEILGIAGVSGNGQNQLADLLSGMIRPDEGRVCLDGETVQPSPMTMVQHGVGRIVEDRNDLGLIGDMTIAENLASESYREQSLSRLGMLRGGALRSNAEDLIERFDVRCPGPDAQVRKLSGGNKQKLVLGRVLSRAPRVILAHQPTWGLDVGAAAYVYDRLLAARRRGSGVLLISEDLDELLRLCDRIQVLYQGRLSHSMLTKEVDRRELGLLMSGHGMETESCTH